MRQRSGLLSPRHAILIDPASGKPARKFAFRPARWLFALLLLLAASAAAGAWLSAPGTERRAKAAIAHLSQENASLKRKLAETEAELDISRNEQAALKKELGKANARIEKLEARVRMFDAILAARKQPGLHLLQPRARWRGEDRIEIDMILVKGGNYPRAMAGKLRFLAEGPDGKAIALPLENSADALSWMVKDHTFLRAAISWKQAWRPDRLTAVLTRHQREIARETINIGDQP